MKEGAGVARKETKMGKVKAVVFPNRLIVKTQDYDDGELYFVAEAEGREDEFENGTRVGVYALIATGEVHRSGYVSED